MWNDPPVFVEDGNPLQARQLDILSDNAAWLYNQVSRLIPAMPVYRAPWVLDYQYTEQLQAQYRVRHVGRYLKVRIYGTVEATVVGQDRPGFKLYYDGRMILDKQWPDDNATMKWTGDFVVDLQMALPGLVIGTRYQIYAVQTPNDFGGVNGYFELTYVYETEMVE